MSDLLYVYGFVPAEMDETAIDVTGIGGAAVGLVHTDDGPHAVVSRLDPGEYSAEIIDARMNDLAWVADQGVAHERVVSWFIDRGDILPAPLFTLYSSDAAVRGVIAAQRERLEREMSRLRGLREWDLKISFDRELLARHVGRYIEAIAEIDRELETAPEGKRYLLARRREEMLRGQLGTTARSLALEAFEDAREFARDAVVLPLPDPGAGLPVALNAALLVAAESEPAILERIAHARRTFGQAGLTIEFSGPWAPYRFIEGAPVGQS